MFCKIVILVGINKRIVEDNDWDGDINKLLTIVTIFSILILIIDRVKSMFRYNPTEHSDQDNLRWCWLRAVKWGRWPLFIAQPIAPILLAFDFNYLAVAGTILCLTYIWVLVRYRFVSPWFADVGSDLVHLKWPVSLICAWLLWRRSAMVPAVLASTWPLVTLALGFITPPTKIGLIQQSLMLSLGYTHLDDSDQPADFWFYYNIDTTNRRKRATATCFSSCLTGLMVFCAARFLLATRWARISSYINGDDPCGLCFHTLETFL